MKRTISVPLTKKETVGGIGWLIMEFFVLPTLLTAANNLLPTPMDDTALNIVFYALNFLAIVVIFREFLGKNLETMGRFPFYFLQIVVVGLGQYLLFNELLGYLTYLLDPSFYNVNDATIGEMVNTNLTAMGIAVIFLVPPAEECLFRGLIFRNLYDKSVPLAWIVSILGFAAIHVIGFIGELTPVALLISILQYVPAGIALAWAYLKADSIFAPILIHAIVNAIGVYIMRL